MYGTTVFSFYFLSHCSTFLAGSQQSLAEGASLKLHSDYTSSVYSLENVFCKVYNKVTVLIIGKNSQCHSCDASCKTCFGPQVLDCASCFKGANIFLLWIIHPYCALYINVFICATGYFLDQEGSCVLQCPSGSFANSATQLCDECSPNCELCVDNSDNCISCSKSGKLFLHRGHCWSNCPE